MQLEITGVDTATSVISTSGSHPEWPAWCPRCVFNQKKKRKKVNTGLPTRHKCYSKNSLSEWMQSILWTGWRALFHRRAIPPCPIRMLCSHSEYAEHSLNGAHAKRPTSCDHNAGEQPLAQDWQAGGDRHSSAVYFSDVQFPAASARYFVYIVTR